MFRKILSAATVMAVVGAGVVVGDGAGVASAAGSSMEVLENTSYIGDWQTLDPAASTTAIANVPMLDAVYGNLFEQGQNNKVIPDLATGYKITDGGKTVTIHLRPNVKFTDGTPFNSAAVKFNIMRDLSSVNPNAATLKTIFQVGSISTPNPTTVVMHMKSVVAPIITAFFQEAPNWIASPTALKKLGKNFGLTPVGAGPFMVKSDKPSTSLDLVANPNYWQNGKPELSELKFVTIGSDESALEAIQAGQAQAYQRYQTYSQVATVKRSVQIAEVPPTQPGVVQLNTRTKPFDNLTAREAMYYATDPHALNKGLLFGLGTITQSQTGPGAGVYFEPKVPGYRTYDLAKAKALVSQLGGLSFTLSIVSSPYEVQLATALKSEWAAAGINATIEQVNIGQAITEFMHNSWSAGLPVPGDFDPSLGSGLGEYQSTSLLTGVKNPKMDALINQALTTIGVEKRQAIFNQIWKMASDQAYGPFTPLAPNYNIAAKGVKGQGLSTGAPQIFWEDVTNNS